MVPLFRQAILPMLALLTAAAGAQTPPTAAFHSTLEGYRRFDDAKPIPWRSANDTVGQIGGWREYARQAQQPAAVASAPASAAAHSHGGHGKP